MHSYESNDQRDFDHHFQIYDDFGSRAGGLYYLSSFHSDDREAAKIFRENTWSYISKILDSKRYKRNGIKIYFDYLNFQEFNAYASKSPVSNNLFFIGFNADIHLRLFALFQSIIATTPIFNDIEGVEFTNEKEYTKIDVLKILQEPLITCANYCKKPSIGSLRYGLAYACYYIAQQYIIFHELGHIMHGHVSYIYRNSRKMKALGETSDLGVVELEFNERHAMELDADSVAVWWALMEFAKERCIIFPQKAFKMNITVYLRLLTFSIGVVVHCLEDIDFKLSEFKNSSHPHGEIRFNWMYSQLINALKLEFNNADYAIENGIYRGVEDVVKTCHFQFPYQAFPNAFSPSNKSKIIKQAIIEIDKLMPDYQRKWQKFKLNPDYS